MTKKELTEMVIKIYKEQKRNINESALQSAYSKITNVFLQITNTMEPSEKASLAKKLSDFFEKESTTPF